MRKIIRNCDRILRDIDLVLMGIILCYLTALSIHSTSICYGETRLNVGDSFIKHLVCYWLIVIFFVFVRSAVIKKSNAIISPKLMMTGISILTASFLVYIVITLQAVPIEDQRFICDAAVGLRMFDFSLFLKNSYLDFFATQQAGIVLFLYGFFSIFGNGNYIAFQLMNAVCIVVCFFLIIQIYHHTCYSWNKIGGGKTRLC